MNLVTIAYKSIRQRSLASSLTALSVALGVMLMVSVLVIYGIIDRVFGQQSIGYNLIVGPKGSDVQLVLNTVYRVWRPIENLPYLYYKELAEGEEFAPYIEEAIPICLGDVTQKGDFPIVGTNKRFFQVEYAPGKEFRLNEAGHEFQKSFDAIIGSEVARVNDWKEGSTFTMLHGGAEGHVHDEKFTVVGRLERTGTPNDKTVFVHLNGFYAIAGHETPPAQALKRLKTIFPHREDIQKLTVDDIVAKDDHHHEQGDEEGGHHPHGPISDYMKEVTSILIVSTRDEDGFGGLSASHLQTVINQGIQAQAVNPIPTMRSLMDMFVGNVKLILLFMTGMIIIVSGVGIFVSIYNSMADRRREIAIMRALGANRQTVFSIILTESILLCFCGGVFGILLGHGLVFAAAPIVEAETGLLIDPFAFEPVELVILPVLLVLASLVGFIPGMTAYRTDVAETLAD